MVCRFGWNTEIQSDYIHYKFNCGQSMEIIIWRPPTITYIYGRHFMLGISFHLSSRHMRLCEPIDVFYQNSRVQVASLKKLNTSKSAPSISSGLWTMMWEKKKNKLAKIIIFHSRYLCNNEKILYGSISNAHFQIAVHLFPYRSNCN